MTRSRLLLPLLGLVGTLHAQPANEPPGEPAPSPASTPVTAPDAPSPPAEAATTTEDPAPPAPDPEQEKRASLLRIGERKLATGFTTDAIVAFRQVAESHPPDDDAATALLGLARAYEQAGESIKAVATYEHLLKEVPAGLHTPVAYLEVGRILRNIGSTKLALARFYSVIHTTLKLKDGDAPHYRRHVRQAQFEIAETHLQAGHYEEAARFFERFNLLDVEESDHAWARFKSAQALRLAGNTVAATQALRDFIARYPDTPHTPEAYFLLASLLEEQNQHEESLRVTLQLLQHVRDGRTTDQVQWHEWQQRTGNQLAHAFFERGEFHSALMLYRALALLDDDPVWRVPLLYQEGLCYERLLQYEFARESYTSIQTLTAEATHPTLTDIRRMASWRQDQLDWWGQTRQELQSLQPPSTAASNS